VVIQLSTSASSSNFSLIISNGQKDKKNGWIRCASSEGDYHTPIKECCDIDYADNTTTPSMRKPSVKEYRPEAYLIIEID
jgi:hypothetical protein